MAHEKLFLDEYYESFSSGQYSNLRNAQGILEGYTSWEDDIVSNQMKVQPLADPMEALNRSTAPSNSIPYDVLYDTTVNAGLMISYEGKEACLRDCAMQSLKNTAGIDGPGFNRVPKEKLAEGITCFLSGSRDKSKIMTRAGKVSAILSQQYQYMPCSKLLNICDSLQATFGTAEFRGGSICHSMTVAEFSYPESASKITAAYNAALVNAGKPQTAQITPVIQFRASDTSNAAAMLITYLKLGAAQLLPIGSVNVPHVAPREFDANGNRISCLDKFQMEADGLFAKMEYDIADLLPKMLATKIDHPGNCFVGIAKYAGIPQKWGGIIEEEVRMDWPDGSDCTFLDIYEALTQVTALAVKEGLSPYSTRVLDLEEGISKVARIRAAWKKYDLPGTVAWSAPRPAYAATR